MTQDPMLFVLAALLFLGAIVIGLAIGAIAWLLYQWPSELRKFQMSLENVLEPLTEALAQAAQAQKEAAMRTQQYGTLMRHLGEAAPPNEEPRTWRRQRPEREQPPPDWQPDWVAQQDQQARNPA